MMHDLRPDLLWPEIALAGLAVLIMLLDMVARPEQRGRLLGVAAAGLAAIGVGMMITGAPIGTALGGQCVFDGFAFLVKLFLVGVLLTVMFVTKPWLAQIGGQLGTHLILVLLSGVGMLTLASANDLIVLFVGLELATIPLMILTALWRTDADSNEAAIKFVIVGSLASAFAIFGIALIWGHSGGMMQLSALRGFLATGGGGAALTLGVILLFAGLAFKTAIAPFHVWVPDVYQGAPTPITAFLAGASKAAGFTALVRVAVALFAPGEGAAPIFNWPLTLAVLAGLTAILGNMAAIWQTNLKRLLAHSSIGHAGFLLMGLAVLGTSAQGLGLTALAFYLAFYAVAVAAVFFVMGAVARAGGGDDLSDFAGLGQRSPGLAAMMLVAILSMAGIPPLAGFAGKIFILKATIDGQLLGLAFAAAFAMVLSAVYTLTILRTLYITPSDASLAPIRLCLCERGALLVLTILLVIFGVLPTPLMDIIGNAVDAMLTFDAPTLIAVAAGG